MALNNFTDAVSISDYDVFVFDPDAFGTQVSQLSERAGPALYNAPIGKHGHKVKEAVQRRRSEIKELIERKGGLILCLLRPNNLVFSAAGPGGSLSFGKYAFISELHNTLSSSISGIRAGAGVSMKRQEDVTAVASAYMQVLTGQLGFHAHFQRWDDKVEGRTILAVDSVGNPVAVEFTVDIGKVCFVPVPSNVPGDRIGAAIVRTVENFLTSGADIEEPEWASTLEVPGVHKYDAEISASQIERDKLTNRIEELTHSQHSLSDYRRLVYGYGKSILEPTVRASFRLFGLTVPEPEDYVQEWDAFLTDAEGRTAIAEVEGSEGSIDVRKYRQLLDYVDAEAQEGHEYKGILVGNGYRLCPPESAERLSQFSDHVKRGAERNGFCLVPGTELFKAACAVLEDQTNLELKKQIRDSLFSVVGPWAFSH